MDYNDFRIIKITESFDKIIGCETILFEFTPVIYEELGYSFNPESENNIILVYENLNNIENYYISKHEEVISIDLDDFDFILNIGPRGIGIQKMYLEKNYSKLRRNKTFWQGNAKKDIESGKQIAFSFTHYQDATFTYGENYTSTNNDIIPSECSELDLKSQTHYLVIDKETVTFCFENHNGVFTLIKGKIQNIDYDEDLRIKKITTLSVYALLQEIVIYEFDTSPLSFFYKSERNAIITVKGRKFQPSIQAQWSLLFAENEGIVEFS
jgi:hypothetical protein